MFEWETGLTANVQECAYAGERVGRIVKLGEVWQVMTASAVFGKPGDVIAMKRDPDEAKRFLQDYWMARRDKMSAI